MKLGSTMPSLDAAPLIALVERAGGAAALGLGQKCPFRRAYVRAKESGRITFARADVLSVRVLGLHPIELWGDAWLFTDEDDGCSPIDTQGECASVVA